MIKKKNFFWHCFLVLVAFSGTVECARAENVDGLQIHGLSTHEAVPKPPPLDDAKDLLYVGLASYLGQSTKNNIPATSLNLSSSENLLILKDSSGIIHKASEIKIFWRRISLSKTKRFSRQVAGPFSSFESANQFASKLNEKEISSVIAYPKYWEVWVPLGVPIPPGMNFRTVHKSIDFQIRPVLKMKGGDLLLSGPISISAKGGLNWKGGIYGEQFLITPDAYGTWTFIEKISLEKYLKGVVPHEIGSAAPRNAVAAQAVLARTWAISNSQRFQIDGYHLCSNTQCQVYKNPHLASLDIQKAILSTSGKVLFWKGNPIHAVYHATNGGVMASSNEAWDMKSLPYLRPRLDGPPEWTNQFSLPLKDRSSVKSFLSEKQNAYGTEHYLFRWKRVLTAEQIKSQINSINPLMNLPKRVEVLKRGTSGRVLALRITGENDISIVLTLDNIRRVLRRLPSTLFVVNKLQGDGWEFSGGGFGHGAGLSQAGAIDLASRGWSTKKILLHYYPGTEYETLP